MALSAVAQVPPKTFNPEGASPNTLVDSLSSFLYQYEASFDKNLHNDILNIARYEDEIKEGPDSTYVNFLWYMGTFYRIKLEADWNKDDFRRAIDTYGKMIATAYDGKSVGAGYFNLAQVYFWASDYNNAATNFKLAIETFEDISDECPECAPVLVESRISLAELFYDVENYQQADAIYEALENQLRENNDIPEEYQLITLSNHALVMKALKKPEIGLNKINKAIEMVGATPDNYQEWIDQSKLIKASILLDLPTAADRLEEIGVLLDGINTAEFSIRNEDKLSSYFVARARYSQKLGDNAGALEFMTRGIEQAKQIAYKRDLLNAYKSLYELSIFHDVEKPDWLLDSLYDLTYKDLANVYSVQNTLIDRELELNKTLKAERSYSSQLLRYAMLTGLVLVFGIAGLTVHFARTIKRHKLQQINNEN